MKAKSKNTILTPVIFSLMALVAWIEFYNVQAARDWQLIIAAFAFVFAVAAGALWIVWLLDEVTRLVGNFELAKTAPDREMLALRERYANTIKQMTPEQVEAMGKGRAEIETIPGPTGPIRTLMLSGGRVPYGFLEEFYKLCSEDYLCPVGWFGEGSNRRMYAEALTKYFIQSGYAVEAAGPNPAAWVAGKFKLAWLSVGFEPVEVEG